MKQLESSGLIWVTGFSASGKTTVSRKVENLLKKKGFKTLYLDGDDLRGIFGNSWGYKRSDRLELAYVYFRMCNHLSTQGYIVIISAVAMFDEVSTWVRENIKNSMQVYLDVPADVRRHRDSLTKGIFFNKKLNDNDYDVPISPEMIVKNYGEMSPDQVAKNILDKFSTKVEKYLDYNRKSHWDAYYEKKIAPQSPSSFAMYVANSRVQKKQSILDIGCGNGRDSAFFAEQGHRVTALDRSKLAIDICRTAHSGRGIDFIFGLLSDVSSLQENYYDMIYSRFVFHAMPLQEEIDVIKKSFKLLKVGGEIYIECRSVNDSLFRKGELLSKTEKVHGHYRRFIVLDELIDRLTNCGFEVVNSEESNGLSVVMDDDPVLIRVCARKK